MLNKDKLKKIKVILIDDDQDFLEQIKTALELCGAEVVTAESEKDGIELISNEDYQLAIFDLMMENDDSGFILSYRSKKLHPTVPVIIVTSVTNETGMQFDAATDESREWIKADALLDKDLRFEQLVREINRLLPETNGVAAH